MNNQILLDIRTLLTLKNRDFFASKSVLVTGASGLIGCYFVTLFQEINREFGTEIKVFASTKSGIFPIEVSKETSVILGDLTNHEVLNQLPTFDLIVHAAGYGQPGKFLSNFKKTMELNSTVTLRLTDHLNDHGQFLFLSTSEIYSGLSNPPFSEFEVGTTNTNHERAPYIEGKRFGEAVVSKLKYTNRQITGYSARLALAYGPGTKIGDSRVLYSFVNDALKFGKISMLDTGQAMRTYCYVLDAMEMFLAILQNGEDDIYNVGGNSRLTIAQLAKQIASITGAELEIPSGNDPFLKSAPTDVWLDLQKIMKIRESSSFVPIEEGLSRTVSWMQANLEH